MEIIANALQTVPANLNVYFTDTVTCGGNSITHRDGSGLITLRGLTNQCRARFKVSFIGNVGIPSTGTAGAISMALAVNGEPVKSSTMITTPTATEQFYNIGTSIFIDVPGGCCLTVSVQNISTQAIDIQNANLLIERVA